MHDHEENDSKGNGRNEVGDFAHALVKSSLLLPTINSDVRTDLSNVLCKAPLVTSVVHPIVDDRNCHKNVEQKLQNFEDTS